MPNISLEIGNILSLIGWRRERASTSTPTKLAQSRISEPPEKAEEEEPSDQPDLEQLAQWMTTTREIRIDDVEMAKEFLEC